MWLGDQPVRPFSVSVDTEIDSEDLLNINKVKFLFNQSGATFAADDLSESRVITIQTNIYQLNLPLVKKNQPSVCDLEP